MSKLTAVSYLLSFIPELGKDMIGRDIIDQAKEMERSQIIDAYDSAQRTLVEVAGEELGFDTSDMPTTKEDAEQYYTLTFKTD